MSLVLLLRFPAHVTPAAGALVAALKMNAGRPVLPILLCSLLAGPALAQGTANGETLFKARCTACHVPKKALDGVRKMPEAERPARLEKFLTGHFAPDAAQRKAIADYLIPAASGE
jgi:hypothetical protein